MTFLPYLNKSLIILCNCVAGSVQGLRTLLKRWWYPSYLWSEYMYLCQSHPLITAGCFLYMWMHKLYMCPYVMPWNTCVPMLCRGIHVSLCYAVGYMCPYVMPWNTCVPMLCRGIHVSLCYAVEYMCPYVILWNACAVSPVTCCLTQLCVLIRRSVTVFCIPGLHNDCS